jgi:hypothetical protein
MVEIISLAARRAARLNQDGQDGHRSHEAPTAPTEDASEAPPCRVLLFTGVRYERGDNATGRIKVPWMGRLEPRDAAEPGKP